MFNISESSIRTKGIELGKKAVSQASKLSEINISPENQYYFWASMNKPAESSIVLRNDLIIRGAGTAISRTARIVGDMKGQDDKIASAKRTLRSIAAEDKAIIADAKRRATEIFTR